MRGVVFAAMLGGAQTDPVLAKAMGEKWLDPRRKWGEERIIRAIEAGECHPGIEKSSALGLLYGPLYAPLLFGRPILSEEEITAHLALALPAIFKGGKKRKVNSTGSAPAD